MLGQDRHPSLAPQVWVVAVIALLVLALVALAYGDREGAGDSAIRSFVERELVRLQSRAAETEAPTPDGQGEGAEALATLPVPTATPEWLAPTPRPTATRRPPDADRRDHYWLQRPIAPPGNARVARFYPYGSRQDGSYPIHHGVEMVNPAGTPVLAPASGVVAVAGDDEAQVFGARPGFYGQLVVLQLDQRYQGMPVYVLMGHLSQVDVVVGQHVSAGQVLGLVGETGYAEGPHLHTEVRLARNDYAATVNPELWYRPLEGLGTLAGVILTKEGEPIDSEAKLVLRRGGQYVYEAYTYPAQQVNPDPEWGENFCIGDLEPGVWTVEVFYGGALHTHEVAITAGETTWLVLNVD